MQYTRLITCGDSFTEGMTDEIIDGEYRGWADRVADVMAREVPGFTYANLAVRGKLVHQVVKDQVPVALTFVEGKKTIVAFHAGANDVIRPNYKPELVLPLYAQTVRTIAASGATVLLFTVLERTGNTGKTAEIWATRFSEFNKNVRAIAKEVGAVVADANEESFLSDARFLAKDRLHLNAIGHDRVAQGVLEELNLSFNADWRTPLPPATPKAFSRKVIEDTTWFITFLLPWLWRRARGKSSGDGRVAKYPTPISWPLH
ncbi:MAG: SGNH/GDSL hydrolase family protein [Actinomycetes bacterium]